MSKGAEAAFQREVLPLREVAFEIDNLLDSATFESGWMASNRISQAGRSQSLGA